MEELSPVLQMLGLTLAAIATLIEDVLTGGVGVVNDGPVIATAIAIITAYIEDNIYKEYNNNGY